MSMAPAPQKRNYRRQQHHSSSDDSDDGFQHPPSDAGSQELSSSATKFALQDGSAPSASSLLGDFCRDSWSEQGRGGGVEGVGAGGVPETSQILSDHSPNGVVENTISSRRRGSQNGAMRIATGVGYNMLRSMGWRENTGLGQLSNGIVDPILPSKKPNHLGIGFNPAAAHDAAQEEIKLIQKAKREERDRKLNLKLEKAQVAEEEEIFMRESFVAVASSSYEQFPQSVSRQQEISADPHSTKPPVGHTRQGIKSTDTGQCPHCRQQFDTKHALKSHINARHAKLLQALKRQFKKERRYGRHPHVGTHSMSGKKGLARGLAPLSEDFSVYD